MKYLNLSKWILLLTVIALVSCSKPTPTPVNGAAFNAIELKILMSKRGIRPDEGNIVVDRFLMVPTKEWFTAQFPSRYETMRSAIWAAGFTKPPQDCDDHARLAAVCGQLIQPGLAVGEFFYISQRLGPHAINFVIVDTPAGREIMFWEPQLMKTIALTEHEITASCIGWRL